MFCANCGTNISDGAAFCPGCGTPVAAAQPAGQSAKKPDKKKTILIAAAAVVALVAIIVGCILIFGGNSPEKVADKFVAALEDVDADALIDLLPMDELEDADADTDWFVEDIEDFCEEIDEEDCEIKCKILDLDEAKRSVFNEVAEMYDEIDIEVEEVYVLELKVTVEYDGDKDSEEGEIYIIKIGSKWYVDVQSFMEFF